MGDVRGEPDADRRTAAPAGRPIDDVRISTDPADLDHDWIFHALSERAYWALGRTRATMDAAIAGSICFSAHRDGRQIGFTRVITDGATFAWICDVFVDESERGRGVGHRLLTAVVADPRLAGLRRMVLATRDAHEVYRRHGFELLATPERWMERSTHRPG
jgi:GNAT superfamily N-acetyltransferase